jgi:hypothetical protein
LEETLFTEALPDLRSDDAVLFRVGQVDDWRRVFSPAQIERVDRLLRSLRERFGWLV